MQCSGVIKDFGGQKYFMACDGIHLNGLGQYKLCRSLRGGGGGSSTLPAIVIAANRAYVSHVTSLKDPLFYNARLTQAFYDFHYIALRCASSFVVLSQADLSVVICFHGPC